MLGQSITPNRYRRLVAEARQSPQRILEFDKEQFRRDYNRRAFQFNHNLSNHPKFQLEALFDLCRRMPEAHIKYRLGEVPVDAEFDSSLERYRGGLTLDEALDNFLDKRVYIAVYNPEFDSEYKPVIERILEEISYHTEAMDPDINWYSTYLFISSVGSVTPFHMDREMNFLLQIRGTKEAKLWGRLDDRVMSSAARDTLLANRKKTRPVYDVSLEPYADVFELRPGTGIHHPFIAPHLITTRSEISISLAVTYRTRLSDIWTDAHYYNYLGRKLGMSPATVGLDVNDDHRKAGIIRTLRSLKRAIRPG